MEQEGSNNNNAASKQQQNGGIKGENNNKNNNNGDLPKKKNNNRRNYKKKSIDTNQTEQRQEEDIKPKKQRVDQDTTVSTTGKADVNNNGGSNDTSNNGNEKKPSNRRGRNRRKPQKKGPKNGDEDGPAATVSGDEDSEMVIENVKEEESSQQQPKVVKMDQNAAANTNHPIFSEERFSDLSNITNESKRAIAEVLKFEFMSNVQAATLPSALNGKDVLAKAKTGSGKTIAFMLPIVEHIVTAKSQKIKQQEKPILAVILAPTRELTVQIASEANDLIKFQNNIKIVTLIGGTNINADKSRLNKIVDIIIATPGRFQDHLNQNTANINERIMSGLVCLCLDEADRLLDMGFRKELTRIISCMPKERQTLLFSATLPESLQEIKKIALKPDYEMINTINDGESNTNVQVIQEYLICPLENHVAMLQSTIRKYQQDCSDGENYKVIVFFNTARTAAFMSDIFRAGGFPILEMHSRKSQSYRTKCAKDFTGRTNVILFSSDVSARGVDYPGVTLVIQVGLTERDQYIHRLGRTARAGRQGRGLLLLSEFERSFVEKELKDLQISPMPKEDADALESANNKSNLLANIEKNSALKNSAEMAYQSFLGYYNSNLRRLGISKTKVVELANLYSSYIGLKKVPALQAKTIGKMGLKGTPGLVIDRKGGFNNKQSHSNE